MIQRKCSGRHREAVSKVKNSESGLRFNTIVEDIKKPSVIAWALLPGQVIIAAFGEEIAYRGFFLGKGMKIFSVIYHKSGNCVISAFSHILGNAISLAVVFTFFV